MSKTSKIYTTYDCHTVVYHFHMFSGIQTQQTVHLYKIPLKTPLNILIPFSNPP